MVEDPPAIRSFRDLKRDRPRDAQMKGEFKPIAALHRAIEKKFVYDPRSGRFTPKNPLGPPPRPSTPLHEAKAKAEKDKTYEKMASGDPEEAMQAAIDFGGVFSKLSEGILSPKKLIPSYKMLVQGAKPPLTGDRAGPGPGLRYPPGIWDRHCSNALPHPQGQRPVRLREGRGDRPGPRQARLQRRPAHDPPPQARELPDGRDRHRLEGRLRPPDHPRCPDEPEDEDGPEPEISPEPAKPSPGDLPPIPGLNLEGLPADIPKIEVPK